MKIAGMITMAGAAALLAACGNDGRQQTTETATMDGAYQDGANLDTGPMANTTAGQQGMAGQGTAAGTMAGNQDTTRVFFAFDQAELTADARQQLDRIAEAYRQTPGAGLTVAGFTDTVGTRPYNQQLSERRAAAVRDHLVSRGVPAGEIQLEAHGQSSPRVDTGDNVREAQNRRVRIEFGDQQN
ncbi:OmpA family protein [Erythrobacteraceae bacterium CFH 75059]|uniref:OmpA family protein n=1 Tax=Qipengyuania thermophila TaxID=2509361 RepID=UPI00101EB4F3|nr:OmpA family protein [Qipengyuania thermophila]TCD06494.1 OmpA family protein [Erythrobacteraceae bacterium CFH 75059]